MPDFASVQSDLPPTPTDTVRADASPATSGRTTRALLACGLIAGPVYLVVGFAQAFTRDGFSPLHDDLSVLANGSLGWIQITNLMLTGALVLACAVGTRRALGVGRGSTWGPRLIGGFGAGLVLAGIFRTDPMNGFPPGTPAGRATTATLSGTLHFVTAALAFICFIAACFVLARRFSASGKRAWAAYSRITGVVFVAAFAGVATGSTSAGVVLAFTAAVVLAFVWLAAVANRLRRSSNGQLDA
jgi:hypothetical membrane protein